MSNNSLSKVTKLADVQPNKSPHQQFYTLSAVAYSCCKDINAGDEKFEDFLHLAMEGYKELNYDVLGHVEVEEIEMKPYKQIDYPCNAVDITKIGFRIGDLIATMVVDNNIPRIWDKDGCGLKENLPTIDLTLISDEIVPFYGYEFGTGLVVPKYYGNALNYNGIGYYDLDERNRVINFNQVITNYTKVYVEFITDGIDYDGETIVHPYAFLALKKYVHWQRRENDDRVGEGAKERAMRIWEKALDKLIQRKLNLSIQDIRQALYSGQRQTPKM